MTKCSLINLIVKKFSTWLPKAKKDESCNFPQTIKEGNEPKFAYIVILGFYNSKCYSSVYKLPE